MKLCLILPNISPVHLMNGFNFNFIFQMNIVKTIGIKQSQRYFYSNKFACFTFLSKIENSGI